LKRLPRRGDGLSDNCNDNSVIVIRWRR